MIHVYGFALKYLSLRRPPGGSDRRSEPVRWVCKILFARCAPKPGMKRLRTAPFFEIRAADAWARKTAGFRCPVPRVFAWRLPRQRVRISSGRFQKPSRCSRRHQSFQGAIAGPECLREAFVYSAPIRFFLDMAASILSSWARPTAACRLLILKFHPSSS